MVNEHTVDLVKRCAERAPFANRVCELVYLSRQVDRYARAEADQQNDIRVSIFNFGERAVNYPVRGEFIRPCGQVRRKIFVSTCTDAVNRVNLV